MVNITVHGHKRSDKNCFLLLYIHKVYNLSSVTSPIIYIHCYTALCTFPSEMGNRNSRVVKSHDRMRSYRVLFCFTRRFDGPPFTPPKDLQDLYDRYLDENGYMTVAKLQSFLDEVQKKKDATEQDAQHIMQTLREKKQLGIFHRHDIPFDAFLQYLLDEDLNSAIRNEIHNDMTGPLSHYFIYTGHNSYLTGNQLSSDSSDEPIIRALKKGVRGIELDIWPNKSKDDVVVFHGRTFTAPVKFIKCIKSIKEHAFDVSDYPVIITLEDHLTTELQAKAAKMITETFGDMLFYPDSSGFKEFPSPESLKHRILISTKPPKEYLEGQTSKILEDGDKNEGKPPEEELSDDETDIVDAETDEKSLQGAGPAEEDLDDVNGVVQEKAEVPEYKKLIAIHAEKKTGVPSKDILRFDDDIVKRISLSEPKLEKLAKSHPTDIVRFSQRNILRIYPKLTRVTSSNFNPLIAFSHGAQMVAFNMQGHAKNLWLVQGFFRANGGCGYVKKPEFLLRRANYDGDNDQTVFNPNARNPLKKTLKVKVYMGDGWRHDFKKTHFDTYSPPDFYTKIGIVGVTADSKMEKTRTIEDNWIPCWDEEFTFPLTVPELALLRIQVGEYDMSEKDDFGGQTCLPVTELKPGIRSTPLFDKKGEKYRSVKLLLRIEFV